MGSFSTKRCFIWCLLFLSYTILIILFSMKKCASLADKNIGKTKVYISAAVCPNRERLQKCSAILTAIRTCVGKIATSLQCFFSPSTLVFHCRTQAKVFVWLDKVKIRKNQPQYYYERLQYFLLQYTENFIIRAVVVAQLVERLLPNPEVRSSNPVICKNLHWTFTGFNCIEKTKIKKKRPRMAHF